MRQTRILVIVILSMITTLPGFSQDSTWQRSYEFGIYNNYDLRNSSHNFISGHRALNDAFDHYVSSKMNPKLGRISNAVFTFATTYLGMLWSHEIGHSIRAKQVGGHFNIHNFGLPVPYTTADLPEEITLPDEAIFVTAGFEVNYLNVRALQSQFIRQNGLWNTDLSLSFANRLMYPIYTSLIVPIDAEDKNVWIETAGDPVHYILPVFKNFSNDQVFNADSSVNKGLVNLYNEAAILATFFNLIDPQFYREAGAAFGKASKIRRPIFLVGNFENGWTYGTLFNASPLGYELYLQNYFHFNGNQYGLYFKYGRPYQNIGLGFSMNDVIKRDDFNTDVILEVWQQDIFGKGISLECTSRWKMTKTLGLHFSLGYKTAGYVLGKQLQAGFNIGGGISLSDVFKK